MSGNRIYADYAATTPLCDAAFEVMVPFLKDIFGNPSSLHSWGRHARNAVWEARKTIAECIGALPEEIFFTSGGTHVLTAIGIGKEIAKSTIRFSLGQGNTVEDVERIADAVVMAVGKL